MTEGNSRNQGACSSHTDASRFGSLGGFGHAVWHAGVSSPTRDRPWVGGFEYFFCYTALCIFGIKALEVRALCLVCILQAPLLSLSRHPCGLSVFVK